MSVTLLLLFISLVWVTISGLN
uniref:Uncharacterized protein n=1 Tax=Moniliophthora roreri TaxID=221103 RepID=A0A0W0F7Q5_MONRR